jgi:ankyrin repeat protein
MNLETYADSGENLFNAVSSRNYEEFKRLIETEDLSDWQDKWGWTLFITILQQHDIEIMKVFLSSGIDINFDKNGRTFLSWASLFGWTDIVKLLIAQGANIDSQDKDGETPLINSLKMTHHHEYPEVAFLLICKGANVNLCNKDGKTALMIAASYGFIDIVESLLILGAEIDIQDEYNDTALLHSIDNPEIAELLIASGANVNLSNTGNNTALIRAAYYNETNLVKLLLNAGANVNAVNILDNTALQGALYNDNSIMKKILVNAGALK